MAVELVDPRRALEVVLRNLSLPCRGASVGELGGDLYGELDCERADALCARGGEPVVLEGLLGVRERLDNVPLLEVARRHVVRGLSGGLGRSNSAPGDPDASPLPRPPLVRLHIKDEHVKDAAQDITEDATEDVAQDLAFGARAARALPATPPPPPPSL